MSFHSTSQPSADWMYSASIPVPAVATTAVGTGQKIESVPVTALSKALH